MQPENIYLFIHMSIIGRQPITALFTSLDSDINKFKFRIESSVASVLLTGLVLLNSASFPN